MTRTRVVVVAAFAVCAVVGAATGGFAGSQAVFGDDESLDLGFTVDGDSDGLSARSATPAPDAVAPVNGSDSADTEPGAATGEDTPEANSTTQSTADPHAGSGDENATADDATDVHVDTDGPGTSTAEQTTNQTTTAPTNQTTTTPTNQTTNQTTTTPTNQTTTAGDADAETVVDGGLEPSGGTTSGTTDEAEDGTPTDQDDGEADWTDAGNG